MAKLSKALGLDLSDLAKIIQSQGRRGDTILAHISPKEAALLKARGGSGTANPITGLPEFAEDFYSGVDLSQVPAQGPVESPIPQMTDTAAAAGFPAPSPVDMQSYNQATGGFTLPTFYDPSQSGFTPAEMAAGSQPSPADLATFRSQYPAATPSQQAELLATTPGVTGEQPIPAAEPSILDKAKQKLGGLTLDQALRLGGIATTGLLGAGRARTGAAQAETMRKEIEAQAAPYYQRGKEYIQRGETGQLLPAQQQAIDAQRAQAAQTRIRAGVSADSTMAQQQEAAIQRQADVYRQNLIDYGYQLVGIGDTITQNAIKAGYTASQDAQNAAGRFYASMASMIPGFTPQSITTQRGA